MTRVSREELIARAIAANCICNDIQCQMQNALLEEIQSLKEQSYRLEKVMVHSAKVLDNIKYDLEASVYTLQDNEFEQIFSIRDELLEAVDATNYT